MPVSMSRRAFLCSAGLAAGVFALGGVADALGEDGSLLRPPGGQDADRFLGACLKCDRCRSICPEGCLSVSTLEDGIASARTPKMDFHKGYCIFCDKCIDVCPTSALVAFDETTQKVGIAVIDEDICIAFQRGSCRKCVDVCEYDAIELSATGQPVVLADACNGCGQCEYTCPTDSLRSFNGSSKRGVQVEPFDPSAEQGGGRS